MDSQKSPTTTCRITSNKFSGGHKGSFIETVSCG